MAPFRSFFLIVVGTLQVPLSWSHSPFQSSGFEENLNMYLNEFREEITSKVLEVINTQVEIMERQMNTEMGQWKAKIHREISANISKCACDEIFTSPSPPTSDPTDVVTKSMTKEPTGLSTRDPVPRFDQTSVNITVIAGDAAVLPCTVENKGSHQILWISPNKVAISLDDRRIIDDYRMSIVRPFLSKWNLYIHDVRSTDGGEYFCHINTDPIQSKSVHLHVPELSTEEPVPLFDQTPINITVIAGHTAFLPCTIENKGSNQVYWMNPNGFMISIDDRRVIDDVRMSIERPFVSEWNLHIRHVRPTDGGEYLCKMTTAPEQTKRLYLHVQVPATILESMSSSDKSAIEGTTLELWCFASGVPEPTITWYRSSSSQPTKEKIGTTGEVLRIHNITRYCSGMYECVADNNVQAPAIRKMQVDVTFPPEVRLRTRRLGQSRGRETLLECLVTGFPQGTTQWTKDGFALNNLSGKYGIEIYEEDHYTIALVLRIRNLDEHDFGIYRCTALNYLGTHHADMELYEIHDPPRSLRKTRAKETTTTKRDELSDTRIIRIKGMIEPHL